MSEAIIKKNGTDYPLMTMPNHYPADRVYLDGDTTKNVQDKVARKADLTNLDLTGTTNTTGSTIASGTYFYLNGTLVRAKTAIASGATFTLNTNYEVVTDGGLNAINRTLVKTKSMTVSTDQYSHFSLAMSTSNVVLSIIDNDGNLFIPYVYNNIWGATCIEVTASVVRPRPNVQNLNITVFYI